jgi:phenylacetate-CoA ligase
MDMSSSIFLAAPFTLRRLRRNRRLKRIELRELQNKKLRAMVKHSCENVPYYHDMFRKADLRPDDIKTVDDMRKIPITTKEDIRDLPAEMITAKGFDLSRCFSLRTSGTSGTPMTLYWSKKARYMNFLLQFAWQLECGDKMTNRQVSIGAGWYAATHPFQKIGIFRARRISPLEDATKQIEQIKTFGGRTLIAYPSCVKTLAKEIVEEAVQGLSVHLIFTGGELLDNYTRELASDAFQAELFDKYGAHEVGSISTECRQRVGYHILSDFVIVESLKDGELASLGEEGELTVTNLENHAMPFMRYNLKDLGVLINDECSCDNHYPLMKITGGRESDVVQLADGKMTSALGIYSQLNHIPGIRQFRVTQEDRGSFTIEILKSSKFTETTVEETRRQLKTVLGDVKIEVQTVQDLKREKSGKFRQFITKVT